MGKNPIKKKKRAKRKSYPMKQTDFERIYIEAWRRLLDERKKQ